MKRYLVLGKELICSDFEIVGYLPTPPEINKEFIYHDIDTCQLIKSGHIIKGVMKAFKVDTDLVLYLDNNTRISLIIAS